MNEASCCFGPQEPHTQNVGIDSEALKRLTLDNTPIIRQAMEEQRIVHVKSGTHNAKAKSLSAMLQGSEFAIIPIATKDEQFGALIVTPGETGMSDNMLTHTKILADQVAIAFTNLKLHRQRDEVVDKLLSIYSAAEKITGELDLDAILGACVDFMRKLTRTEKAIIILADDDREIDFSDRNQHMVIRGKIDAHPEKWWKERLRQHRRELQKAKTPVFIESDDTKGSIICVPLRYYGQLSGVMASVFPCGKSIDESDIMILSILARFTAMSVENNRLTDHKQQLVLANERTRIAQDMHDGLAQSLFSLVLNLEVCSKLIDDNPQTVKERLPDLQSLTSKTLKEVRQYIYDLRPGSLDEKGLPTAIECFLLDFINADQAKTGFVVEGEQYPLAPAIERALYYIGREAVVNAMRHSKADEIKVKLSYSLDGVTLDVLDNGQGFEVESMAGHHDQVGHLGLTNMRERAQRNGGRCHIVSSADLGTRVTVSMPRTINSNTEHSN